MPATSLVSSACDLDALVGALVARLPVDPPRPGWHGPPLVVDLCDEVGRSRFAGSLPGERNGAGRLRPACRCAPGLLTRAAAGGRQKKRGDDEEERKDAHLVVAAAAVVFVGSAVVVGFLPDDLEVLVQADLDLAPVVEPDLDAVGGAVVADLRLGDRPAARVLERRRGRLVEGGR